MILIQNQKTIINLSTAFESASAFECWRRKGLVTSLRCWWRLWLIWSPTALSHQHSKNVNDTSILYPTIGQPVKTWYKSPYVLSISYRLWKNAREWPPTQTPTQNFKVVFSMFDSQEIRSSLVSFEKIFEALLSQLFRFKFHSLWSKILKFWEFNLSI